MHNSHRNKFFTEKAFDIIIASYLAMISYGVAIQNVYAQKISYL